PPHSRAMPGRPTWRLYRPRPGAAPRGPPHTEGGRAPARGRGRADADAERAGGAGRGGQGGREGGRRPRRARETRERRAGGAGAYICGEETALLDSLEGRRGQPRPRPPFPPVQGLYNAPTQVNNVCTIATLPIVLAMGAEKFAKTGAPTAPGTAIFSISGNVERPGNYELELGTPMRELIY